MQKYIDLKEIPEYDSLYQDIYIKDLITLRYNIVVYDLYHKLIDNSEIWSEYYNIQNIYMKCTLIDINNQDNKFIVINNKRLYYPYSDSKYNDHNTLREHFNFLNYKKFIGTKFKMITECVIEYNDKFDFRFDGDTGDKAAGDTVNIKDFSDAARPYDHNIVGRTVRWINSNGDTEEHKITWIRSDKRRVKFDGDINDTDSSTTANSIEDTIFTASSITEHRFNIKG